MTPGGDWQLVLGPRLAGRARIRHGISRGLLRRLGSSVAGPGQLLVDDGLAQPRRAEAAEALLRARHDEAERALAPLVAGGL